MFEATLPVGCEVFAPLIIAVICAGVTIPRFKYSDRIFFGPVERKYPAFRTTQARKKPSKTPSVQKSSSDVLPWIYMREACIHRYTGLERS